MFRVVLLLKFFFSTKNTKALLNMMSVPHVDMFLILGDLPKIHRNHGKYMVIIVIVFHFII